MEKPRAISPEIAGLFDKIIQQAAEYQRAFEILEKKLKDFDAAITKLNEMESELQRNTETAISRINTNILESIILLKNKTEEAFRLANDLGDIKQFKKEMENLKNDIILLQSNASNFVDEMDKSLKFFKKKSEIELESTLIGLKSKIEKEVANEAQKIELRINMRLKQIESIVVSLDEKLKSFEVNFSSVIKKLSLDVDILKYGYSTDINKTDEEISNLANQELSDRIASLENTVNILADKIERRTLPIKEQSNHSKDNFIEDIENKISSLTRKVDFIDRKVESSQSNTAVIISAIALIVAIIALILKFI